MNRPADYPLIARQPWIPDPMWRDYIVEVGTARHVSKRDSGIDKIRIDGSETSVETDIAAFGCEVCYGGLVRVPFNGEVYRNRGDGGSDFTIASWTVDVVHLGFARDGTSRVTGNLIMNPDEPQRFSDIYVQMVGTMTAGFWFMGWATHAELASFPLQPFTYGMRLAMPVQLLHMGDMADAFPGFPHVRTRLP